MQKTIFTLLFPLTLTFDL